MLQRFIRYLDSKTIEVSNFLCPPHEILLHQNSEEFLLKGNELVNRRQTSVLANEIMVDVLVLANGVTALNNVKN